MKNKLPLGWIVCFFAIFSLSLQAQQYVITNSALNVGNPGGVRPGTSDLTQTGETVLLDAADGGGTSTNAWSAASAIPFSFDFNGSAVTHFIVSKNGLVSFDTTMAGMATTAGQDVNVALPSAALPNNTVAGFWNDFPTTALGSNDDVWVGTFGTAPNRQHWIRWHSLRIASHSFSYFAVVLEEGTNNIYVVDMNYGSGVTTYTGTVGIQVDGSTAYDVVTPLNGTMGSPNVAMGSGGSGTADNEYYQFQFFAAGACFPPTGLAASNITASSVDLNWTTGGASNWQIEYGPTGFTNGTGTLMNVGTNPFTLSSLSANTFYDVYVRDSCGAANVSLWNGPVNFKTLCSSQLSGTYTINSANPTGGTNFNSFGDAAAELNQCGISGAVTFNIAAGTYTEKLHLENITGSSATNTITFDGSDSALVTLTFSSTTDTPTVFLDGADWVTLTNMTIETTSSTDGWCVFLWQQADNNTIDKCHLKMPVVSFISDVVGVVSSGSLSFETSGDNADNTTISNCTFTGGEVGVNLRGGTTSATHDLNNNVTDCVFRNQDDYGIYMDGQSNFTVKGNDVGGLNNSGGDGIYLFDINDFEISFNEVVAPDWGMYVSDANDAHTVTNNSQIFNNMVISTSDYGMYLNDFENVNVFYNTTNGLPGIAINDQINADIRNNIFASGNDFAFESFDALTAGDVIDYNVYYSTNANHFDIGVNVYADLAAWQAGDATRNVNSAAGDPIFANPSSDLHVSGTVANDVGVVIAGITTDIDEEMRSATTPDIGADEFSPPSCTQSTGLAATNISDTSATLSWTAGGGTTFTVEWGPAGFTPGSGTIINNATNPVNITGLMATTSYDFYVTDDCGAQGVSPQAGPVTFTSGFPLPKALTCTSGNPSIVFTEEFAAVGGWTGDIGFSNGDWEIPGQPTSGNTGPNNAHSGPAGSFMSYEASNTAANSGSAVSPAIDLSAAVSDAELSFWLHAYGASIGKLTVGVGTSATGPFTPIFTWQGQFQTSGNDPWENVGVDLSAYVGQTIYLEFFQKDSVGVGSGFDGDIAIDLIEVSACLNCPQPTALGSDNVTATSADVYWTSGGASNWDVQYGTSGFSLGSGTIISATNDTLSLSSLMSATDYEFYVRDSCGAGDVSAWVGPMSFTTLCATFATPFSESFDNSGLPNCWTNPAGQFNIGTNASWGTPTTDHTGNGGNYAWVDDSSPDLADNTLESPNINIATLTNPQLSFFYWSKDNTVTLSVDVWDGTQWNVGVATNTGGTGSAWAEITANLSAYLTAGTIRVRFVVDENNASCCGNDVAIDDVTIAEAPACPNPGSLGAFNVTATSAEIYWTTGGASNWNVQVGTSGFTLGAGLLNAAATNDTVTVTGLSAQTTYEFYVQDSCGVNDVSAWVGPFSFTTLCAPLVPPQLEDFTSGFPPNACWDEADGGTPATGPGTLGTGAWGVDGFGNVGFTGAARINLWNLGDEDWILTPQYDLSTGGPFQLEFDFGVFAFGGTAPTTLGSDDQVQVLISTDNGATWINLATFDNTYVTGASGNHEVISLSSYSGIVQFAVWATEGTVDDPEDNDIFVDNFEVKATPVCNPPSALGAFGITDSAAQLYWTAGSATNWNIEIGLTGFTLGSGLLAAPVTNDTVNLTGLTPQTGYEFYVQDSCGAGNVSAWVGPFAFTTACSVVSLPYIETFEPTSPTLPCVTSQANWALSSAAGGFGTSTTSLTFPFYNVNGGTFSAFSPEFQPVPANYQLSFDHAYSTYQTEVDSIVVYYSMDGGTTWTLLVGLDGGPAGALNTGGANLGSFTPSATQWSNYAIALPVGANMIRVDAISAFGNNLYIDNLSVDAVPSCSPPSSLGAFGVSDTSAQLYWTTGGSSNWNVQVGAAGFTLGSGLLNTAVTNDTVNVTGLMANTPYEFYVQDSCGPGNVSAWVGPFAFRTGFTTLPPLNCTSGNPGVVWTEEFDAAGGWTGNINAGNGSWEIPGTPTSGSTGPNNAHSGAAGSFMSYEASSTTANSGSAVSPPIDLTIGSGGAQLSFWMHAYGASIGTMDVGVGTSATGPFTTVFTWSGQLQTSGNDPWVNVQVDISSYVGQTIYLEFFNTDSVGVGSGFDGDIAIDLIEVSTCVSCPQPSALGATNVTATTADLFWTSGGSPNADVEYGTVGFTLGTGTVVSVTNDTTTLSTLMSATDYEFYVRDSCGTNDVSAWVGPFPFTTLCATFTAPFSEAFTGSGLPNCWTNPVGDFSIGTNASWGTPNTDHTGNGGNYAWVDDSSPNLADNTLESPDIDISALTNPALSFWYWSKDSTVSLSVDIWDGTQWNIGEIVDSVGTGSAWQEMSVNISSYLTTPTIRVRFVVDENNGLCCGNDVAIDDVLIDEQPTCPNPGGLGAFNITTNSANVFWTTGGASNWNVEYGVSGFTPGTGTQMAATNDTILLSNLNSSTNYQFYVQDSCGMGDVSMWIGPFNFFTLCGPIVPPSIEDFSAGFVPTPCWDEADGGDPTTGPTGLGTGSWTQDGWINSGTIGAVKLNIYSNFLSDWILTPEYDLSSGGTYQVEFDFGVFAWNGTNPTQLGTDDQIQLLITNDNGATWTNLATFDSSYVTGATGNHEVYNLAAYAGDTVRFGIWGTDGATDDPEDNDIFVDNFEVKPVPVIQCPVAGPDSSFVECMLAGAIDLSTYLTGADTGGVWSEVSSSGALMGSMFNVSTAGPGSYSAIYVVSATGCPNDTATISISVDAMPSPGSDATDTVCIGDTLLLSSYLGTFDPGGTWWDISGSFTLPNDTVIVPVGATGTNIFGYTVTNACGTDTALITLTADTIPNAGMDATGALCIGDTAILSSYLGTFDAGGIWLDMSDTSQLANDTLIVPTGTAGTSNTFAYVVTSKCNTDTAFVTLSADTIPNAGTDGTDNICDTATVDLSTYLGTHDAGGTWIDVDATGALSGSVFDVSQVAHSNTYTFRYVVSNSCGSDTATVAITADSCKIGLDELDLSSIQVYPNPTSGIININTRNIGAADYTVEVYNMSGQLIDRREFAVGEDAQVDISHYAQGIYNLTINVEGQIQTHRIVRE